MIWMHDAIKAAIAVCVFACTHTSLYAPSANVQECLSSFVISFFSQEMGKDFEQMAEVLIPALVQLLQNSAKIMSSSGLIALKFIVQVGQLCCCCCYIIIILW